MNETALSKAVEAALSFPEKAKQIQVQDELSARAANDFLAAVKTMSKLVHEAFDPQVKAAKESHDVALSVRARYLAPLLEAEAIVKPRLASWMAVEARKRREAEDAKQRAMAEAKAEADRKLDEAAKAEMAGDKAKSEELIAQAVEVESAPSQIYVPRKAVMPSAILRKVIRWRLLDKTKVPLDFLELDEVAINKVVRVYGLKTDIPGIETYEEDQLAVKGDR